MVLYGAVNIAIITAIAFRYASLHNTTKRLTSFKGVVYILLLQFTACIPLVFLRKYVIGNQEDTNVTVMNVRQH